MAMKPNVLVFFTDRQRFDTTGVHGNPTTYTKEGKQYVAIVYGAGGGGIWPLYYANFLKTHTKGGGLMVFTVE